jgi:hypothetical protein
VPVGGYTLALDFDGTIVDGDRDRPAWLPGARAFVLAAVAAGIRVVVHTCRATSTSALGRAAPGDAEEFYRSGRVASPVVESWQWRDALLDFLEREKIAGDVEIWDQPGKPMATLYVDDRAARPDFASLAAELGLSLADGPQGHPALGARQRPGRRPV